MNDITYQNTSALSDKDILINLGEFIQQARLKQNKTQAQVAKAAAISRSTLSLLERGETVTTLTLLQVLRVLDLLHLLEVFRHKAEISPVEYYKMQEKKRKRASGNNLEEPEADWTW